VARNKIQFQRGLSETGFAELYASEEQCRGALEQWRWPNGFICPECGATKSSFLAPRRLYQCAGCGRQTSVTAGTIFHRTKLPLTTWFRAMYLMTQSKNGVSAMELMRRLDVNYDTAWKLKHKLAQVMLEREATRRLDERVEVDDSYLGGERPGKPGRGAEGKTPFIAAVQTDWEGRPQRMVLHTVSGFTSEQVCRFAEQRLAPTAGVIKGSDNLAQHNLARMRSCCRRRLAGKPAGAPVRRRMCATARSAPSFISLLRNTTRRSRRTWVRRIWPCRRMSNRSLRRT